MADPGPSASPHCDGAGENALSSASVKCEHEAGLQLFFGPEILLRTITSSLHSVMYTASDSSVFLCIPRGLCCGKWHPV